MCQKKKICSPLPETLEGNTEHVTLKKKKINRPPLSNIKGRESLSYLECIQRGTSNGQEGAKQVHQASNQIKEKQNKLSSTHLVTAIACNNNRHFIHFQHNQSNLETLLKPVM